MLRVDPVLATAQQGLDPGIVDHLLDPEGVVGVLKAAAAMVPSLRADIR